MPGAIVYTVCRVEQIQGAPDAMFLVTHCNPLGLEVGPSRVSFHRPTLPQLLVDMLWYRELTVSCHTKVGK